MGQLPKVFILGIILPAFILQVISIVGHQVFQVTIILNHWTLVPIVTQLDGQSSLRQPSRFKILAGPMLNLMEWEPLMAVLDAFIAFTNIAKAIQTLPGAFPYFASATISCQTGWGQSHQCRGHVFGAFWKPFPQI